ncbi:MAG: hypothetical protein WCS77_10210 [Elusimicrobiaceae bacterium]
MPKILAVYREKTNSPNREQDDALILEAVARELETLGAQVKLIEPSAISAVNPDEWDAVIPMCENPPALITIGKWAKPLLMNPVSAVFNCYRVNMTPLMTACDGIHPQTEIRAITDIPGKTAPAFCGEKGVWIKRGDVHNTCDHDVVYVKTWADSAAVRADFESREITKVVIQEHIDGDLIKFYGVGPFKWFGWFYHSTPQAREYKFDLQTLESYAASVAKAVGLEVYGGDAIITPQGRIYIIDINSWPSFARVRNDVKKPIAEHIYGRVAKKTGKTRNGITAKGAVA